MSVAVVVVAAGQGRRMGGVAKPFIELAGQPMLRHALQPFLADPRVHSVSVVLRPADAGMPPAWLTSWDRRIKIVAGGSERSDSVRAAVDALAEDTEVIVIHDAARPLVTQRSIGSVIDAAQGGECVTVGVPLNDTVHQVDGRDTITATPDRRSLRLAQTPQAFPARILRDAIARAAREGEPSTDEAGLVAGYGFEVRVLAGERENFKITEPSDLVVAEAILAGRRDAKIPA